MTLQISKLTDKNFNEVYKLLKQAQFPYLPSSKKQAFKILFSKTNHLYGGFFNNELKLFMCFCQNNQKLYFDIACQDNYRKKWATKKVIKFIFNKAFNDLSYDEFYTESFTQNAIKSVEKLGFVKLNNFNYVIRAKSAVVHKYLNKGKK
jgi:hypothetical protein